MIIRVRGGVEIKEKRKGGGREKRKRREEFALEEE